jgi:hypothetical protein
VKLVVVAAQHYDARVLGAAWLHCTELASLVMWLIDCHAIAAVCSKRRSPDIMEVADQLQQLPALSSDQAAAAAAAAEIPAADLGAVVSSSSSLEQRQHLIAKRFKMAGGSNGAFAGSTALPFLSQRQQQHVMVPAVQCIPPGSAAPSDDAAVPGQQLTGNLHMSPAKLAALHHGSCGRNLLSPHHNHQQQQQQQQAGVFLTPGAAALPGSSSSSHHGHHGHHVRLASRGADAPVAARPASNRLRPGLSALIRDPTSLTANPAAGLEMQQQQLSSAEGMMDTSHTATACKEPPQDMMDVSLESGGSQHQWHQGQHQLHPAGQLPVRPAAAPVFGAARLDTVNIVRSSSVIAMLQVTVTEALGLN